MHLIVKPDGLAKLGSIDDTVRRSNFKVNSVHHIQDWNETGKAIYRPQINESKDFARAADVYFSISQELFGKEALMYWLSGNEEQPVADLRELFNLKLEIRSKLKTINDKGLVLLADTTRLPGVEIQGTSGKVLIGYKQILPFDREGSWVYFFFKYVHSCDPDAELYAHETRVLRDARVFEAKYSDKELQSIKRGLISPRLR